MKSKMMCSRREKHMSTLRYDRIRAIPFLVVLIVLTYTVKYGESTPKRLLGPVAQNFDEYYILESLYLDSRCSKLYNQTSFLWPDIQQTFTNQNNSQYVVGCAKNLDGIYMKVNDDCSSSTYSDSSCTYLISTKYYTQECTYDSSLAYRQGISSSALTPYPAMFRKITCERTRPLLMGSDKGHYVLESIYSDSQCSVLYSQTLSHWEDIQYSFTGQHFANGIGTCVIAHGMHGQYVKLHNDCSTASYIDAACTQLTMNQYYMHSCRRLINSSSPQGTLSSPGDLYKKVTCSYERPSMQATLQFDYAQSSVGGLASEKFLNTGDVDTSDISQSISCILLDIACEIECNEWPRNKCVKQKTAGSCYDAECHVDPLFWVLLAFILLVLAIVIYIICRKTCCRKR